MDPGLVRVKVNFVWFYYTHQLNSRLSKNLRFFVLAHTVDYGTVLPDPYLGLWYDPLTGT